MPCAPLLRFSDCTTDTRSEAGEVMSGILEVIGGGNFTAAAPVRQGGNFVTAPVRQSTNFTSSPTIRQQSGNFTAASTIRQGGNFTSPVRQQTSSQRVFVRVYRTSSEHFAVLYPVRAIVTACRPLASLNLKSCTVKQLPNCVLRVSPRSCEGMAVTFKGTETTNEAQIAEWLRAFSEAKKDGSSLRRKKVSDHRLPLPVLVESEEDEESLE